MIQLTCSKIYTKNALILLKEALKESEHSEDFFMAVDELNNQSESVLEYSPAIEFERDLLPPANQSSELDNAKTIYEALGAIDRANASDPRLWGYLALNTFREYMSKRWPLKSGNADIRSWRSRIEQRWLMSECPSRAAMTRHGIARLWWLPELTYDGSMKHSLSQETNDPYAYTAWLMANQQRVVDITEREYGSDPEIRRAIIEVLSRSGKTSDNDMKSMAKRVQINLSYRDLGVLDEGLNGAMDSIREMAL